MTAASGPHQSLAQLPTGAYDCVIALWDGTAVPPGDLGFRHLRRTLRPGGVLLLVVPQRLPRLREALVEVFGWDGVRDDSQKSPGPSDRPLTLFRAALPVS